MSGPLLLLHGALGAASQFDPLLPHLAAHFDLLRLDFEGHGARAPADRPLRARHLVENVTTLMDAERLERIALFGYSLGGYVACSLALEQPGRVRRIATLGTKFLWDHATAARESRLLDPEQIQARVPHFAAHLERTHPAVGWRNLLAMTTALLHDNAQSGALTPEQMARLEMPVRIMVGDRDRTVSLAESRAIYRALPAGEFEVLPRTPHPFDRIRMERLASSLIEFFEEE